MRRRKGRYQIGFEDGEEWEGWSWECLPLRGGWILIRKSVSRKGRKDAKEAVRMPQHFRRFSGLVDLGLGG